MAAKKVTKTKKDKPPVSLEKAAKNAAAAEKRRATRLQKQRDEQADAVALSGASPSLLPINLRRPQSLTIPHLAIPRPSKVKAKEDKC